MKQYWTQLASRINAANLRERILIFLMVVVVAVALVNALLIDPVRAKQASLARQVKQDQDKIAAIQNQIQELVASRGADPDIASRERIQDVKQQIAKSDETLLSMQKGLVRPDQMAGLIEDILQREGQLQLVSLKTLPVSNVLDLEESKTPPIPVSQSEVKKVSIASDISNAPSVYKHGVELVIKGNYADLTQYIARLESMSTQMFWGKAEFKVEGYPRASLKLTIFTLGLDKTWLRI